MNTQKIAITVPANLLLLIDEIAKTRSISRSKFISSILKEKIFSEKDKSLKKAYDKIFSDDSICKEQLETAAYFEREGNSEGQQW